MRLFLRSFSLLSMALLMLGLEARAQAVAAPDARPSPLSLAQITTDNGTYVKVVYGSPRKRDRVVFGELVPYGQVWRLGANEATELTLTKPVMIAGKHLNPGTYSLFAIPNQNQWTLIVNRTLGLWGAYNYKQDADVFRVDVPATTGAEVHEAFTLKLEKATGGTDLLILWDNTRVVVPIRPM